MTLTLKLSVHPDRVYKKSIIEEELIIKEINELPPLAEGQVSIDKSYIVHYDDQIEMGLYLRNASSDTLYFGQTTCELLNNEGNIIAKQSFDLSKMGDIEPFSVRPWEVFFDKENVYNTDLLKDGENYSIRYQKSEGKEPYVKIVQDKEPDPLNEEELSRLNQFIRALPTVKENTISVSPFDIKKNNVGELLVTIIVRHGCTNPVKLSRFQLGVIDNENKLIAKAVFKIEEHVLEPNFFFLRTFTYPPELILEEKMDLSSWNILVF